MKKENQNVTVRYILVSFVNQKLRLFQNSLRYCKKKKNISYKKYYITHKKNTTKTISSILCSTLYTLSQMNTKKENKSYLKYPCLLSNRESNTYMYINLSVTEVKFLKCHFL